MRGRFWVSLRTENRRSQVCAIAGVLVSGLLAVGCQSLKVDSHYVPEESDWVTEGGGAGRSHRATVLLEPPLEEIWSYNAGAGFGSGPPLLLGDRIFVATRRGEVHIIDAENGKKKTRRRFKVPLEGTPVLGDSVLFLPFSLEGGSVTAFDLFTGKRRWHHDGPSVEVGLLLFQETLYVVDDEATLYALNPHDGSEQWSYTFEEEVTVHTPPVGVGERVMVADDRGRLYAFDAHSGRLVWERDGQGPVYQAITADDERVYVPTTRGRLHAVDRLTGRPLWAFSVPDTTVRFSAMAVSDEIAVFSATDGYVRALDAATGEALWQVELGVAMNAAPLITSYTVYAGALDGRLVAMDRTSGAIKWETEIEGRLKSAFAADEEALFILSENQKVYRYSPTHEVTAHRQDP